MSSIKQRSGAPVGSGELIALWAGISSVGVLVAGTWIPTHLAARLDDEPAPTANPFGLLIELVQGQTPWTTTATVVAIGLGVVLVALAAAGLTLVLRIRRRAARVDRAAAKMGRGRDVASVGRRQVQATADRLGIERPGIEIGRTVAGGQPIFQDWESVSVDVMGPRTGKTTARAIPAIMAAPGAVLATSNKRDLVDATRDPRGSSGRVWVFDPQGVAGEQPTWWWNPLSYVVDVTRAQALADVFATASRKPGARTDAYFDGAAVELVGNLLLAAAAGRRPITQIYRWITDPNDDEPARLLAESGHELPAASVRGAIGSPDKQRAGIFGTAQQLTSFLTNPEATAWVTPPAVGGRDQFHPADFVASADTLYSLSREGRGNAGPLVTALTVAVCEAAEDRAKAQPGGRLAVPMVVVLDEAANVCRWSELPNLYSHYGSRGITVLTFLQSWSQGVETWGRDGMRKLWSAATVKVYGGGVSEVEFLDEVARLIGEYQHTESSVTFSGGGAGRGSNRSTSHQHRKDRILDVADLAALDRGRVVVFASGAVPTLARTMPWYDHHPRRAAIAASVAAHDPAQPQAQVLRGPAPEPVAVERIERTNPWLT